MTGPLQPSCSSGSSLLRASSDCWQALSSPEAEFFLASATPFEERELLDVCSFVDNGDLVDAVTAMDMPEPHAAGESYRQGCLTKTQRCAEPKANRKLGKQHSFPSAIDREEAWERKKELYGTEEFGSLAINAGAKRVGCNVSRSVSDCGERTSSLGKTCGRARTRSLTDDDLEELRGCIDLGFGFSADKDGDLSDILPALDLYYAINRQYRESQTCLSPGSPCEASSMLSRTSTIDSTGSPNSESWRVSSPGDTPSQVKTRLRHWAQAVACSVKQGFSL